MKKIFSLVLALAMIFILTMPLFAIAEETVTEPDTAVTDVVDTTSDIEIPTEPFTWAYLATIAGAATFTLLVVQFFKVPLDRVWRIPTRLLAYCIALVCMLVATAFTTGLDAQTVLLAAANAFIAALISYGAYELTFAKIQK